MKIKVEEFIQVLTETINEDIGTVLPKVLEDKEINAICESNNLFESSDNEYELIRECAFNYTYGVFEALNINKEKLNEIAPLVANVVGRAAVAALRPIAMNMLKKYGIKFFSSAMGKKILQKLGCKTISSALGKLFGKEFALKLLGRGGMNSAVKGVGKGTLAKQAFNRNKLYTTVGTAIGGMVAGKNKNPHPYMAESIDIVLKRHFHE